LGVRVDGMLKLGEIFFDLFERERIEAGLVGIDLGQKFAAEIPRGIIAEILADDFLSQVAL
jgi:hypothetical protein